ncbi:MAG TPA: hypothetical protein VFH33_01810 [Candidatus Krumholzibacteria bacterium]|nr:hypothetical protein [Candidatus Krumholzibacteria bacterium]
MRACIGLALVAAVAFLIACGDDSTTPPPPGPDPDTTAPEPVSSLTASYDAGLDVIVLRWTAPRDDEAHERVDHYEVRRSHRFPFDWESATVVDNPPAPLEPGSMQELVISHPLRASDLYASVRSVDAAGNISRVGGLAHAGVPGYSMDVVCTDVYTGSPIAGLNAVITSGASQENALTDAAGSVHLSDLDGGVLTLGLSSGSSSYHLFRTSLTLDADTLVQVPMIPVQQPQTNLYPSILELLRVANFSVGGVRVIKRWHSYPVQFYAPDLVNVNGLDYRALLQQAADRWNTRLGFQMFAATSADPATGILFEFLPISAMGTVNGVTEYANDARGYPVHDRIRIVDAMTDGPRLYSIFMHELGHTIPFAHLPAGFIMFAGQPLPSDISDDEVTTVKLFLALPNGTNLDNYDPPAP